MAFHKYDVYLALVGNPVVEIAAVVYLNGISIEYFHEFINYFNGILNESYSEIYPITDSFGTRFEHAISENDLHDWGQANERVVENLNTFLNDSYGDSYLSVNDIEKFNSLNIHHEIDRLWDATTTTSLQLMSHSKRCKSHRSTYYYNDTKAPICARTIATTMARLSDEFYLKLSTK